MRSTSGLLVLVLAVGTSVSSFAQQRLTAAEAKAHVGEQATVCGSVASVHYATRSKGEPTFINLDKPYPNQIFTILIWGSDRPKFGSPEQKYSGKEVCATGAITVFRDVPEIVAHDPAAIKSHSR
jgi:micrococcal nuclease